MRTFILALLALVLITSCTVNATEEELADLEQRKEQLDAFIDTYEKRVEKVDSVNGFAPIESKVVHSNLLNIGDENVIVAVIMLDGYLYGFTLHDDTDNSTPLVLLESNKIRFPENFNSPDSIITQ